MEGYDFSEIARRDINISFWVKSSVTGTHCLSLGSGANDASYVTTYTINNASTWEKKSIVVRLNDAIGTWSTNENVGLYLRWSMEAGATYKAGSLNTWLSGNYFGHSSCVNDLATNSNVFFLSRVQLTKGAQLFPFSRAGSSWANEWLLANRYFTKTFDYGVAPASNAGNDGSIAASFSSNFGGATFQFPVSMRTATPSCSTYNPTASGANFSGNYTVSSTNLGMKSITAQSSAGPASGVAFIHFACDADY